MFQGDKGYLYIPYRYMTDTNYVSDVFVVKKFSKIEFNHDHWKENVSQLEFSGPNTFGASAAGFDHGNEWDFEQGGNGEN
jgi:hypothetical protein